MTDPSHPVPDLGRLSPRSSALGGLAWCPGFWALRAAESLSMVRSSSRAADTGTAVGRAIELWHRGGETVDAAIAAVGQTVAEECAPQADWDTVREQLRLYTLDARNHGVVLAHLQEHEVRAEVPADPDDPTGAPVVIVGHVDQIRRAPNGGLQVWDLKSGKPSGLEMTHLYAWQLAAYAVGCTETLGEDVLPGGIIRTRGYTARGADDPSRARVHYATPWSLDQCRDMLGVVAYRVGEIRRGLIATTPGAHCMFCSGEGPALCPPRVDTAWQALERSVTPATPLDPLLVSQLAGLAECAGSHALRADPVPDHSPRVADPDMIRVAQLFRRPSA